jgi:hypothetical protein
MQMKFHKPITGDTRNILKFAWYPIRIGNVVYWLEWITIHQSYNTKRSGWNNDWRVSK